MSQRTRVDVPAPDLAVVACRHERGEALHEHHVQHVRLVALEVAARADVMQARVVIEGHLSAAGQLQQGVSRSPFQTLVCAC